MSYEAKVIADSVGPNGARITTFQLRFPRFILAQFNTHRSISKNARSSRAVPVERLIAEVESDPVIPIHWGKNQRGMSATRELSEDEIGKAQCAWLDARDEAVERAKELMVFGVHKQIANRLLEPYMWVDVVATATDWANFFALRCDRHAQPEIQKLAVMMARAYRDSHVVSRPTRSAIEFPSDLWHLPYVTEAERDSLGITTLKALSVARCARVSYLAFDGKPSATDADLALCNKLRDDGHMSPFEHQGQCQGGNMKNRSGNFRGWDQYRQMLPVSVHHSFDYSTLDAFDARSYMLTEAK